MAQTTLGDSSRSRKPRVRDFPFYDGQPLALSVGRWLVLLGMVALGFFALVGAPHLRPGYIGRWGGILAFVALPLLGLRLAAGHQWAAPFYRPTVRDVLIGLAFVPVTILVSSLVALELMQVSHTVANSSTALLKNMRGWDLAWFLAGTAPQLLGEELVTILPLLALLAGFYHLGMSRRVAVAAAWILSAMIFGALHLSTYQWHIAQALVGISAARLILSLPYLITKNIWSSTITHVTHDWLLFAGVAATAILQ